MLVAVINLLSVCKLNTNGWNSAADVKALPSPNVAESDAPPGKSGGDNLVSAQLIRINSQLPVNPLMNGRKHGVRAQRHNGKTHSRRAAGACVTEGSSRRRVKCPWSARCSPFLHEREQSICLLLQLRAWRKMQIVRHRRRMLQYALQGDQVNILGRLDASFVWLTKEDPTAARKPLVGCYT